MSAMRGLGLLAAMTIAALAPWTSNAFGREIWANEDLSRSVRLESALTSSVVFPSGDSATNLWRLRLGLRGEIGSGFDWEVAYENRARLAPGGGSGLGILPQEDAPFFRIRPLDSAISETADYVHRHELDRAVANFRFDRGSVSVGRQAIGWGQGVFFGALDFFAPFSPLDLDREWRRGVDAVHATCRLADTWSLEAAYAAGNDFKWNESAMLARLRGYRGEVDASLIAGRRAEDNVIGGTVSAAVGGAAAYGELAIIDTPEDFPDGALFGGSGYVAKATLGISYIFDIGDGLSAWAEYHRSGFGFTDAGEAFASLSDPAYQIRFLRGDTQTLNRDSVAFQLSYPFGPQLDGGLAWIASLNDGSRVIAPSVTWGFAENVALTASVYFANGAFYDSPTTVFLQIRLYD